MINAIVVRCVCNQVYHLMDIEAPFLSCPYCDFVTNNFSYEGEFRNRDLYHAKQMRKENEK